jgi:hypothetical protein
VYDVLFLDRASRSEVLAEALKRESAVSIARAEASRRRVGRMFLAGSEDLRTDGMVLIVAANRQAAQAA